MENDLQGQACQKKTVTKVINHRRMIYNSKVLVAERKRKILRNWRDKEKLDGEESYKLVKKRK